MLLTVTNEQMQRALAVARIADKLQGCPYHPSVAITGAPGGGKTWGARVYGEAAFGAENVYMMRTGHRPVTELEGLPEAHEVNGRRVVRYLPMEELPQPGCADGEALLDEIDRQTDETAVAALAGLALDGILGSYKMPDNVQRVATMNGCTDDGTIPLPKMARQRFLHLYLDNRDFIGYKGYLEAKQTPEAWMKHLQRHWMRIQEPIEFEDLQGDHKDYRRNYDMAIGVDRALTVIREKQLMRVDDIRPAILQGFLGFRRMAMLLADEAVAGEMPDVETLLRSPATCKIPTDGALQIAIVVSMQGEIERIQNGQCEKAATFLARLRRDVAEFGFQQLGRERPELYGTEAYLNWANK